MNGTPNLTLVGQLIGDPTRTLMLELLYDGQKWSAAELACGAGVTPQTASSHLRKLVDAGWLTVESKGRHKFFRIAGSEVADALEALLVLATRQVKRPGGVSANKDPLRQARTCYDHLAGHLGVSITNHLLKHAYLRKLSDSFEPTQKGEQLLANLDIDTHGLRAARRPFTRCCMDWSERRHHLGGGLGAAMLSQFVVRNWIRRHEGTRAVTLTNAGTRQLRRLQLID